MSGPTNHALKLALEEIALALLIEGKAEEAFNCGKLSMSPTFLTMLANKLAQPSPRIDPAFGNCLQNREPRTSTHGRFCLACGQGPCKFSEAGERLRP